MTTDVAAKAGELLDDSKQYSDLLRGLVRSEPASPMHRGEPASMIPLNGSSLVLGSHLSSDIVLDHDFIKSKHATIEPWPEGFAVHDAGSGTGTYVNGRAVKWAGLKPGDLLQLGPYLFQFKKSFLLWLRQPAAITLAAVGLRHAIGDLVLLDRLSLIARPGEFVGLLGPSGSGKTTLLNALSGLVPVQTGQVLLNGESLLQQEESWKHRIGYVPQEDIVHLELTPRQAFRFAARLRMPACSAPEERAALVDKTLVLLDLTHRADVPIHLLSGGQRKRVSVGVELLGRPQLLFLDEPTSGLDPATEAKLMNTLRDLAHQGRTILCTTHIMENVELFDRIAVLAPGGKLAYFGPPEHAIDYFEVDRFSAIYGRLEERSPEQWRAHFLDSTHGWDLRQDIASERQPRPFDRRGRPEPEERIRGLAQGVLLLRRFTRTLLAEGKTPLLIAIQPLLIGGLIGMVFGDARPLGFLLVIATLWFGCSLSAQQIVKERVIIRRERRVNLDWIAYLLSKFALLFAVTMGQALAMWAIVGNLRPLPGELEWQLAALALAAANGVAFGLVVSALSTNANSATAAVPLALIPQVVLAGLLVGLPEMNRPTQFAADLTPSRWSYRLIEAAWLEGRRVDVDLFKDAHIVGALANLHPDYAFKEAEERKRFLDDHVDAKIECRSSANAAIVVLGVMCMLQLAATAGVLALKE